MTYIIWLLILFFFFNDTATTEIYTLSLHDALPIYREVVRGVAADQLVVIREGEGIVRSEEHTSEIQSLRHLVCRLLLEKKKKKILSVFILKKKQRKKRKKKKKI